jgi:hypothetical protein
MRALRFVIGSLDPEPVNGVNFEHYLARAPAADAEETGGRSFRSSGGGGPRDPAMFSAVPLRR